MAGNDHGVERGPPLSRQPKAVGASAGPQQFQAENGRVSLNNMLESANATSSPKHYHSEGKIMIQHWMEWGSQFSRQTPCYHQ